MVRSLSLSVKARACSPVHGSHATVKVPGCYTCRWEEQQLVLILLSIYTSITASPLRDATSAVGQR